VELIVKLGTRLVGQIVSNPDGRNEFSFLDEYLKGGDRPVLGQYFEDHLGEVQRSQTKLPPFFSNLLPEGGLRELLARRAGVHPDREAHLLAHLGEDLPGAVVVSAVDPSLEPSDDPPDSDSERAPDADELRFSLAGAQLKFSVLYGGTGRGPTVPVDGRGGTWIAKLPSEHFESVPENEYSMILWAREVGITVPEVALVAVEDIESLPVELAPTRKVFLSRRFDRMSNGGRIHQEDFAQVRNVRVGARYGSLTYDSLARIVRAVAGDDSFEEVIRRLAFNVIIGNGDAHLKNWSLTYPDGVHAQLSPAYDLVSTVVFIPGDRLALRLAHERDFAAVRMEQFKRLADRAEVSATRVVDIVRKTVADARAAWQTLAPELPLLSEHRTRIGEHLAKLPLVRESG
jgi:serine/threonine-protein kinase HipA